MNIDLLIHDGTVIDGTAAPPFRADVAIKDGRILDIGAIEKREGVPCLDAQVFLSRPASLIFTAIPILRWSSIRGR